MDVTIEKLIYGGDGLAHDSGATIFVPFVLPAERVAISPVEQKKKFLRAQLARAVVESLSFSVRAMVDAMVAATGQLAELVLAPWSPIAAVEHEHDGPMFERARE